MKRRDLFKAAAALVAPVPEPRVLYTFTVDAVFFAEIPAGSWPLVWAEDFERWRQGVAESLERIRLLTP